MILLTLLVSYAFVLAKMSYRLEKWAAVVLLTYFCSAALCAARWIVFMANDSPDDVFTQNILDSVDQVTEMVTWAISYYFVFEMNELKNKFESETHEEYIDKKKASNRAKYAAISWLVIASLFNTAVTIKLIITERDLIDDESIPSALLIADVVFVGLEIFVDMMIAGLFCALFRYFLALKRNKLKSLVQELSRFNKFIISVIVLLIFLNCFSSLCRLFQTPLYELVEIDETNEELYELVR